MIELPGLGQGPKIDRQVQLVAMGDWGQANFHRILSWLCQEVNDRVESGSTFAILNGKGGVDSVRAVAERRVDLAISTPASFSRMAVQGLGPFQGEHLSQLRALAVLPQDDRLIMAVDRRFSVQRVADIATRKLPLRIALGTQDGLNFIGVGARGMLEASGLARADLESWGGKYLEYERPEQCLAAMERGEADAMVQEAIMTPWWLDVLKARDLDILSWDERALASVEQQFAWERATLRAGYYPGQDTELQVLQFSDFQLMVHEDMDEDIAHLITWCICNTSRVIERQFQIFPPDRTPMGYPLVPARMSQTVLDLHPGAARCYEELAVTPSVK